MSAAERPPLSSKAEGVATGATALLALLNVAPLLAWVFGLGAFSTWFVRLTVPALLGLVVIAVVAFTRPAFERLRMVFVIGAMGGLLGTIGYDLFRVPFVMAGREVLAPIESYGVLLLNAPASSGLSSFSGWTYHVANGICFGIAYAAVMLGRSIGWAVVWALVLETATVVTPFATYYHLRGKWDVIAIAYAAHIPYGLLLGWVTRRPRTTYDALQETGRWVVPAILGVTVLALAGWLRPWSADVSTTGFDVGSGRFEPRWVRVAPGDCVKVSNTGDEALTLQGTPTPTAVPVDGTARVCLTEPGVTRLGVAGRAWSGGYVIVDPQASPGGGT